MGKCQISPGVRQRFVTNWWVGLACCELERKAYGFISGTRPRKLRASGSGRAGYDMSKSHQKGTMKVFWWDQTGKFALFLNVTAAAWFHQHVHGAPDHRRTA